MEKIKKIDKPVVGFMFLKNPSSPYNLGGVVS